MIAPAITPAIISTCLMIRSATIPFAVAGMSSYVGKEERPGDPADDDPRERALCESGESPVRARTLVARRRRRCSALRLRRAGAVKLKRADSNAYGVALPSRPSEPRVCAAYAGATERASRAVFSASS